MPYIDPITTMGILYDCKIQGNSSKSAEIREPAFVHLFNQPTDEELDHIFSLADNAVVLSGSAAAGSIGQLLGKIDISESDDTYYFRVALPGVATEGFTYKVAPNGNVVINGVVTTGEKTVVLESMKFEMLSQNLGPQGPFSISFKIPGPVDALSLTTGFGIDGIFEGMVQKKIASN